jgi:hypothetical protein
MATFLDPQLIIPLRRRFLLRALVATAVYLISRGRLGRAFHPAPDQSDGLTRGMADLVASGFLFGVDKRGMTAQKARSRESCYTRIACKEPRSTMPAGKSEFWGGKENGEIHSRR